MEQYTVRSPWRLNHVGQANLQTYMFEHWKQWPSVAGLGSARNLVDFVPKRLQNNTNDRSYHAYPQWCKTYYVHTCPLSFLHQENNMRICPSADIVLWKIFRYSLAAILVSPGFFPSWHHPGHRFTPTKMVLIFLSEKYRVKRSPCRLFFAWKFGELACASLGVLWKLWQL